MSQSPSDVASSEDAQALGLKRSHAARFRLQAKQDFEAGRFSDAVDAAFVAASCDASSEEHWLLLGAARAKLQQFDLAAQAFVQATTVAPTSVAAWTNLGEAQIAQKDFSAATKALQKAIELDATASHPAGRRARMLLVSRAQWKTGITVPQS